MKIESARWIWFSIHHLSACLASPKLREGAAVGRKLLKMLAAFLRLSKLIRKINKFHFVNDLAQ